MDKHVVLELILAGKLLVAVYAVGLLQMLRLLVVKVVDIVIVTG